MVPIRANSAVFCWIDMSWPLLNAQPLGAKLKPMSLISEGYCELTIVSSVSQPPRQAGSVDAVGLSGSLWEQALQGDAHAERQRGHHVVVRQAASRRTDRRQVELDGWRRGHLGVGVDHGARAAVQHFTFSVDLATRAVRTGLCIGRLDQVIVNGVFHIQQGYVLGAAELADLVARKSVALARAYHDVARNVGKPEVAGAVAAIRSSNEREQGRVLRNGQDLPVAQRPLHRRKNERKHADLGKKLVAHLSTPDGMNFVRRRSQRGSA